MTVNVVVHCLLTLAPTMFYIPRVLYYPWCTVPLLRDYGKYACAEVLLNVGGRHLGLPHLALLMTMVFCDYDNILLLCG